MSYKVIVVENDVEKITNNCSLETAKELIRFFDNIGYDAYAVPEL